MIEKFDAAMQEYMGKFGDYFPTMCFQTDTEEQMIERINQCVKENKTAEELFDLDYENNVY